MSLFEEVASKSQTITNNPELSVSEISSLIKKTIDTNFSYVKIRGEVSGFKAASSGHVYFSLKDQNAILNVVCWKAKFNSLPVKIEDGLEIVCCGSITTFAGQSKYQLVVESIELGGVGALMAMLEKRKQQLAAEGLFDPAHKKPLPRIPQTIAVITSPQGAVIRDIIHRIKERYPLEVIIFPVAVQGEECPKQVINAINLANSFTLAKIDLIIVARGGGSIEDLWGFNDEMVVRAAFASKIPIISAIGHETDYSLLDLVADKRAPTPTAAAEFATPDQKQLIRHITQIFSIAANIFDNKIYALENRVINLHSQLLHPLQIIETLNNKLLILLNKIDQLLNNNVNNNSNKLITVSAKINADLLLANIDQKANGLEKLSLRISYIINKQLEHLGSRINLADKILQVTDFKKLLAQGFAILRDNNGKVVSNINNVKSEATYSLTLADGEVKVKKSC